MLSRIFAYSSLYRAVVYGIIQSAIIRVAADRTRETIRIGLKICLTCIPLERRARISFCDDRFPMTMLADASELNGMVYMRNCGIENMTRSRTSAI